MTDLRKAAEMALKNWLANDEGVVRSFLDYLGMELKPEWVSAVSHGFLYGYEEALRQALAEDALKTVADIDHSIGLFVDSPNVDAVNMSEECVHKTDKSIHEPVAYEFIPNGELLYPHELERRPDANYVPLYTAPPKREWVGLTDEEVINCFDSVAFGQVEDDLIINKHVNIFTAIHYIEAKLKEKNT